MSRNLLLAALCLGAATFSTSACSQSNDRTPSSNADRPPVLDALEASGLTVVDEFPVGDGLRGFAGSAGQQPIAVYITPGGDAIVGTRVDRAGNERDAQTLQKLVAGPMGEQAWSKLEAAEWIRDGRADAPRVIYTFSDPNCPYCNQLWQAARPWVDAGKVQLRHVMVGVIREDSAGKAATILGAADPEAKLVENERNFARGGVTPARTVPAGVRRTLDGNQMLMMQLGFRGTPAVVFRGADGRVDRRSGMPQGPDLETVLGPR